MNYTSFSMQNILNDPIDAQLCKKILQQIKSPLLQQSFALTNDQSLNNQFINQPRRPNIPPPSQNIYQYPRRPAIKNKYNNNTFGNTYTGAELNKFYQQQNSKTYYNDFNTSPPAKTYPENRNFLQGITNNFSQQIDSRTFRTVNPYQNQNNFNNQQKAAYSLYYTELQKGPAYEAIGSIVSPLDPNITLKQNQNQEKDEGIFEQFCGNLFNATKHDRRQQIEYYDNFDSKKYQRRKIFTNNNKSIGQKLQDPNGLVNNNVQSILLMPQTGKSHISIKQNLEQINSKTLKQVIYDLQKNHHLQIADFVEVITKVIDLLIKAQKQRKFLLQNIELVYQLMDQNDKKRIEYKNQNSIQEQEQKGYRKFLQRMNYTSIFDLIKKISRTKLINSKNNNSLKQYQSDKNKVQQSLDSLIRCFSSIQTQIQKFLNQRASINKLKTVYSVLKQKFTNKSFTKNTYHQFINLFKDIRLTHLYNQASLMYLQYIWNDFSFQILSQQDFINNFVRGNGRYRENKLSNTEMRRQIDQKQENEFQSKLSQMGFVRN